MSARNLSWVRPTSKTTDGELVSVSRGQLRELSYGLAYLLAVCEANDASDPDDPSTWSDDRRFLVEANNRLAALAGARADRPASVGDLCNALVRQTGCDPTRADKLVAHLASEGRAAADDLLDYGLSPANPNDVAALLLTAAAKHLAG